MRKPPGVTDQDFATALRQFESVVCLRRPERSGSDRKAQAGRDGDTGRLPHPIPNHAVATRGSLRSGRSSTGVDRFAVANFDDRRASARRRYERPNPVATQRDTLMSCDPFGGRDSVWRKSRCSASAVVLYTGRDASAGVIAGDATGVRPKHW